MRVSVPRQQHGFSLFEFVVYILMASILFAAAFNRYRDMPAEAERANVSAVLAQLKTGVNLQMMHTIATGNWHQAGQLEGSNPMDLMLETPFNYVGVYDNPDHSALPRRIWYFNRAAGELVYLAENTSNIRVFQNGALQPGDTLRFRIRNVYQDGYAGRPGHWLGLRIEPVVAYQWQSVPLDLAMSVE